MTDETFTELVDLYLDEEISEKDLTRLKRELSADLRRRQIFVERNRLHRAMRLALNPSATEHQRADQRAAAAPRFSRWFLGTGLAATLVLGWVLFSPAFFDQSDSATRSVAAESAGASEQDLLDQALSDWNSEADLRRYASRQQRGLANERASLAAQLRLMGLRPELIPQDKSLRAVNPEALRAEPTRSQAELLTKLQRHAVMPKARILRSDVDSPVHAGDEFRSYGNGFESSLISFR